MLIFHPRWSFRVSGCGAFSVSDSRISTGEKDCAATPEMVVVDNCGDVVSVPVGLSCCSGDAHRGPVASVVFRLRLVPVDATLGRVVPPIRPF